MLSIYFFSRGLILPIPVTISFCVHVQLTLAVDLTLATCVVTPTVIGTVTNLLISLQYTLLLLGLTVANLISFAVAQLVLALSSVGAVTVILNVIDQLLTSCPTNC